MKKLIIIHYNLLNPNTGGLYYLAQIIRHFQDRGLTMEVVDCEALPHRVKENRASFILHFISYLCRQRDAVILTNHGLHFRLLIPVLLSKCFGNRYVIGGHLTFYNLRSNIFMKTIEYAVEKTFLRLAFGIIYPSITSMDHFKVFHLEHIPKAVINPAPQLIAEKPIVIKKRIERLLFCGHVVRRKGLDILLEALHILNDPSLLLDVAGLYDRDSEYYKAMTERIERYGLGRRVVFHGDLAPRELDSLYRNSDLFVFPSRHETYGMVLVEAMSYGLPIVASTIPTNQEMIRHQVNGLLYPVENPAALAASIRILTTNVALRGGISRNNLHDRRYSRTWSDVADETLQFLRPQLNR